MVDIHLLLAYNNINSWILWPHMLFYIYSIFFLNFSWCTCHLEIYYY